MGFRKRVGVTVMGVGLLLTSLAPAAAGTSQSVDTFVGIPIRIREAGAAENAEVPVVAYNSRNHQYLIVWSDYRDGATRSNDVYGQLMKENGTLIGSNFRISGNGATGPEYPVAVAYNSVDNQYLVVWQDERHGEFEIYGRRIKANGRLAGGDFLISSGWSGSPAIAHNPVADQYLVVWTETAGGVHGQRIKANGVLAGDAFRISGDAGAGSQQAPEVVCNIANGQFFVVWMDSRPYGDTFEVFGRRLKKTGAPAGSDFMVNQAGGVVWSGGSAVAYNSIANQYLVVWEDNRNYLTTSHDIYGRRVKAGGQVAGGDIRISGNPAFQEERKPVVAYDSTTNRYLVAWEDLRDFDTRGFDIYARRVKGGGNPTGKDLRVVGNPAIANDKEASVAYGSAAHQFLVVWSDARDWGIYGRQVNG